MNASHALSTLAVLAVLASLTPGGSACRFAARGGLKSRRLQRGGPRNATEAEAEARRERLRRFRYGNLAEIELSGKQVKVSYADLATDSDDYRALEALEAGEVSAWQSAKAIKLIAQVSLSFGDVTVPYGNHSPDYPGVYSLWPKRTADGWRLVFNSEGGHLGHPAGLRRGRG